MMKLANIPATNIQSNVASLPLALLPCLSISCSLVIFSGPRIFFLSSRHWIELTRVLLLQFPGLELSIMMLSLGASLSIQQLGLQFCDVRGQGSGSLEHVQLMHESGWVVIAVVLLWNVFSFTGSGFPITSPKTDHLPTDVIFTLVEVPSILSGATTNTWMYPLVWPTCGSSRISRSQLLNQPHLRSGIVKREIEWCHSAEFKKKSIFTYVKIAILLH